MLVGGLEHEFYVPFHIGISSFSLRNSYFLRWLKPPTRNTCFLHQLAIPSISGLWLGLQLGLLCGAQQPRHEQFVLGRQWQRKFREHLEVNRSSGAAPGYHRKGNQSWNMRKMRTSPAGIWNCILINLEDLAVDPLLVTSMWSVIFDPHLLFDLIFYLSGRPKQNKQCYFQGYLVWYAKALEDWYLECFHIFTIE